jgi:O-acetylserine/cysteine efflux transporter
MKPLHIFLAVCVMAAWGINFVIIKMGLDSFPPILLSALRFALAGLPIIFIWKTPPAPIKWIVAIGLSLAIFKFNLLFIGMNLGAGAGLSSLVLQTQAFFTVILAFFLLGEKPGMRQLLGMGFAFCGLGLIVSQHLHEYGAMIGLMFVITSAICWALANLAMKQAASKNPLHLMIWVSAISAPFLFIISYIMEGGDAMTHALGNINATGAFSVFYLAFIATLAGFGVWAFLLRTYQAAYVAPFSLLVPIFGMSSAALLLGEKITFLNIIAALLILTGLAINTLKPDFFKRSKAPC